MKRDFCHSTTLALQNSEGSFCFVGARSRRWCNEMGMRCLIRLGAFIACGGWVVPPFLDGVHPCGWHCCQHCVTPLAKVGGGLLQHTRAPLPCRRPSRWEPPRAHRYPTSDDMRSRLPSASSGPWIPPPPRAFATTSLTPYLLQTPTRHLAALYSPTARLKKSTFPRGISQRPETTRQPSEPV